MNNEVEKIKPSGWEFVGMEAIDSYVPMTDWIVNKLIPHNSIVGVVGASGSGKSCIVYDILMSYVSGFSHWFQFRMRGEKRDCVLLTSEGDSLLRLKGWKIKHGQPTPQGQIRILKQNGMKLNDSSTEDLITALQTETDLNIGLVVIDTLNGFYKGKENDNSDMGDFLNYAVRISEALEATVIIIHHKGKNSTDSTGRGASAFNARLDMNIEVTGKPLSVTGSTIKITKARDSQEGLSFKVTAELVNVTPEPDEDGEYVTAMVLKDASPLETVKEAVKDDSDYLLIREGISEGSIQLDEKGFITRKNLSEFFSSHGGEAGEGFKGQGKYAQSKPIEEGGKGVCARLQGKHYFEWDGERESYRVDSSLFQ